LILVEEAPSAAHASEPQLLFAEAKARRRRRWVIGGIVATVAMLGLLLAAVVVIEWGAGGNSTEHAIPSASLLHHGELKGVAGQCSGPANLRRLPVEVIVYQGRHVVVEETKLGSHPFSFSLAPGQYRVTTNQSYVIPVNVTLHPGEVTHALVLSAACD
jgi:hypothetical protein